MSIAERSSLKENPLLIIRCTRLSATDLMTYRAHGELELIEKGQYCRVATRDESIKLKFTRLLDSRE